jgi:hypothetical protein
MYWFVAVTVNIQALCAMNGDLVADAALLCTLDSHVGLDYYAPLQEIILDTKRGAQR